MARLHTCSRCRALFPVDQSNCPHCETSTTPRLIRERGGLFDRMITGRFGVTAAILTANVVLYVGLLAFQGGASEDGLGGVTGLTVLKFGGLAGPLVLQEGHWYRLICPIFLHFGLLHVGFNCLVIWFLGSVTERVYGPAKFLAVYLLMGIFALIVSLLWRGNGPGIAAGASGAGFGLFGLIGVFAWRRGLDDIKRTVIQWTLISLVYGLASKNIDNAAHLGGLAAGILIGLKLRDAQWTRLRPVYVRAWDVAAIVSIAAILVAFGFAFVAGRVIALG